EDRGIELTAGQPAIHPRITEGPTVTRGRAGRGCARPWAPESLVPLEGGEQSPELLDARLSGAGGWRRCEKGGNRTAARETHTLTRTPTGTLTRTGTLVRIATD